jgi:exopolysaccharide biosynthesis protein
MLDKKILVLAIILLGLTGLTQADFENITPKKTEPEELATQIVVEIPPEILETTPEMSPTATPSPTPSIGQTHRSATTIVPTVVINNAPPASGYQKQNVKTESGVFVVDIISADLNNTRVIVDTASIGDCQNNCPVLPLADYVNRNGAFAGINGTYFCPETYPDCANRKNNFDMLVMNKNKYYFNSDNNVYSTLPAFIFGGNWARVVTRTLEWGRDTGVDAVIANQPLLVLNGQIIYGGGGNAKWNLKGPRDFIAHTSNMVYIGIVRNATLAEAAKVLQTMGIANAMNLDSGGSTALWFGGYKAGPGRNIPNAVLFVRK